MSKEQIEKVLPEITKENIADAATSAIRAFAAEAAGLTFAEDAGRDFIIQEVFKALEWDAYRPEADATHVVVNLPVTKDEKHPYRGGFNGVMFSVKRGVDVELPIGYYNTMIESAERRYAIAGLGQSGEVTEGSPAGNRIPLGALDLRVVRFLNKGNK